MIKDNLIGGGAVVEGTCDEMCLLQPPIWGPMKGFLKMVRRGRSGALGADQGLATHRDASQAKKS